MFCAIIGQRNKRYANLGLPAARTEHHLTVASHRAARGLFWIPVSRAAPRRGGAAASFLRTWLQEVTCAIELSSRVCMRSIWLRLTMRLTPSGTGCNLSVP